MSSIKTSHTREVKNVPFNSIFIDPELNSRKVTAARVKEIRPSIEEKGLLSPLQVSNGGPKDKPYTLRAGFHRAEVLTQLKWGSKEVPVIVVTGAESPVSGLIENVVRNDMTVLETADRITALVEGTYKVPEGETAEPHDKKILQADLGFSQSHMGNMLRLAKSLCKGVRDKIAKHDVPSRFLFAWASLDTEEKQEGACDAWLDLQAQQEKMGTKGKHKKRGTKSDDDKGGKSVKKVAQEDFDVLCWLSTETKGSEKLEAESKRDALGFVLGITTKRLTNADQRKGYERHLKEEAKAAEAAAAEEEEE